MDGIELLGRFARSTVGAVFFLLIGLGMMAGAVAALVAELPDGYHDLRVYESASLCPTGSAELADCRWTKPFTVTDVDPNPPGRSEPPYTVLKEADGDTYKVTYGDPGPVLITLEPGDRLKGTIWRGRLTEISAGGASQRTSDAPADMRARGGVLAMILLPSGLVLTIASAWRLLRRRASPGLTPGQRATFSLSLGLLMTGLLSPIPATWLPYDSEAQHAVLTAVIWLPIAALLIIVARVYTVRKQAR
ncbi:MAG: hypothetical protein GEV11_29310 [Streptosporangiales bacterium]|nr:hypothetical protein [Streptosporangiales bacterium]